MGIPRLGLKVEAKGTSRKGELGYLFLAFGDPNGAEGSDSCKSWWACQNA